MIFDVDARPAASVRRVVRPLLVLIVTLLAVSICILGTAHVFMPVSVGA
jgi:hypothetical protein